MHETDEVEVEVDEDAEEFGDGAKDGIFFIFFGEATGRQGNGGVVNCWLFLGPNFGDVIFDCCCWTIDGGDGKGGEIQLGVRVDLLVFVANSFDLVFIDKLCVLS